MHHSMQKRVDGLAALRARSLMATAEFYELIGRSAPAPEPLFQAVAKGNAWHIIEIATGKTKGFCFSYKAAMVFVDAMEAGAAKKRGALQQASARRTTCVRASSEPAGPLGNYRPEHLTEVIEATYTDLRATANPNHLVAAGWIATPTDTTIDEAEAAKIFTAFGA